MKILKDQSAHTTTRAVGVAIDIYIYTENGIKSAFVHSLKYFAYFTEASYSYMHLCINLYIWLLKYKSKKQDFQLFSHSLLHIDRQALTSHVGKILLSIW